MSAIEKLRKGYFDDFPCHEVSHPMVQNKNAKKLADEIEAENEIEYIPRPRFDDGEPVRIGECDRIGQVTWYAVFPSGDFVVFYAKGSLNLCRANTRLERPETIIDTPQVEGDPEDDRQWLRDGETIEIPEDKASK